jgi:uncharacterized protein YuzE
MSDVQRTAQVEVTWVEYPDMGYIRLTTREEAIVEDVRAVSVPGGQIILDLDKHGRLIGIEVMNPSQVLPADLLGRLLAES